MNLKHNILIFLCKRMFLKKIIKNIRKPDKGNRIILIKRNGKRIKKRRIKGLYTKFGGSNNYIEIKEPFKIKQLVVSMPGNNNILKIGEYAAIGSLTIAMSNNSKVTIGKKFYGAKRTIFIAKEEGGAQISIGDNCLFSYDVIVRTSDTHTIYDNRTKEVLNCSKNIKIGNHVWVAARAIILKGVEISDNSVIAAGSIVTKKFTEPNALIAGIPAKIKKREINWNFSYPEQFLLEQKQSQKESCDNKNFNMEVEELSAEV